MQIFLHFFCKNFLRILEILRTFAAGIEYEPLNYITS